MPDVPNKVMAEEMPDSDPDDNNCKLLIQLSPPSNIDKNHIQHYLVQYPSGHQNLTDTVGIVTVPNCTLDVRLNVSAVNICDEIGASASDIEPMFMKPNNPTTTSAMTSASTSESISTSSTLCAVLLIILFFVI